MAFCSNCGQELVEGAKFCYNCGVAMSQEKNKTSQRQTVYDGVLHKCSNCGELLDSFVVTCPSCGYELRSIENISSVKELALKLEKAEENRNPSNGTNVFAQVFAGYQLSNTDEYKVSLIKNYAIPNTKEDILEFIILASSSIDCKVYGINRNQTYSLAPRELSDAWLAKFEQAYAKAQITFGDSKEFLYISRLYDQKKKEIHKEKKRFKSLMVCLIAFLIVMVFGGMLLPFLLGGR